MIPSEYNWRSTVSFVENFEFLLKFYSDPGGHNSHPGGPGGDSGDEKQKIDFFENLYFFF